MRALLIIQILSIIGLLFFSNVFEPAGQLSPWTWFLISAQIISIFLLMAGVVRRIFIWLTSQ